ncbi:hypothetical protein V8G54_007082 [Vigna mungo]|uniref:Uncharacterized protein n=1 Tax=Vigna mungo TaxID=3915 RepID=A0AAQ3P181_VIGMU
MIKEFFQLYSIYLAHIHAISNLAADRTDSRERSLKGRRVELGIAPSTLKTTAFGRRILRRIMLPSNTSHSLLLCRCKGENLTTSSTKGAMVVIQNSLVTVFITDVSEPS